jgi:hypothetical protein
MCYCADTRSNCWQHHFVEPDGGRGCNINLTLVVLFVNLLS